MPETDNRDEGKGLPKGSSGAPASGPGEEEAQAAAHDSPAPGPWIQPVPAGGMAAGIDELPAEEDVTGGQSIGDFADSVVSGLEQASFDAVETQGPGLHDSDLEHMSEAFFAGWGSPDEETGESDLHAAAQPANVRTLSDVSLTSLASGKRDRPPRSGPLGHEPSGPNEMSQMGMVSWSASEGVEEPSGDHGRMEARSISSVSEMGLASWGASEGVADEESLAGPELEPEISGTQTLAGLGFPSETVFSPDYAASPSAGANKHDELADAVESALRSVYGNQPAKPAAKVFEKTAIPEEKGSPSLVWNRGANPASDNLTPQEVIFNYFDYTPEDQEGQPGAQAEPVNDSRTPQEVILNYFDYPGSQNGNGYPRAGMAPSRDSEEPITLRQGLETLRPGPEPIIPLRRAPPPPEERSVFRQEWAAQQPQPQQYSGPPSFPVPGPALGAQRPTQTAAQESSRLLGAAAIGLMGGIAIAASLAAFLIYGPHPAAVDIPGIGNLRLDHDEQGYGRAIQDDAARDPARSRPRASVELSGEILAADAVAVPGQPAPLAISIRSQQPSEKMLVSVAGIPEGGRLNAGINIGGGNWLVAPKWLNGLTVNLPAGVPDVISLEAQLLDSNARTPLSAKGTFAVRVVQSDGSVPSAAFAQNASPVAPAFAAKQPQSSSASYPFTTQILSQPGAPVAAASLQPAAPDVSFRTQTVPPPPQRQAALAPQTVIAPPSTPFAGAPGPRRATPRPEVEDLIREGNKHMREGDIVEARQFYQRAVAFGDAEAALAMGRSFDPIYFARIEKKNADPDAAKALDWYKRAMDAGASQTAMVRIENLKHFLNE